MKYIKIVFFIGLLVTIHVADAMRIIPRVGKGGVPSKIPGGLPKGSVPFPFMPKPNTPVVNQSGSTTIPTQQQKIVCSAALKDIAKPLPQRQDVQPVASLLQPVDWLRLLQTQDVKVPEHKLEGELLPQEEKIQTITDIVQVCKPILNTEFQEEGFVEKKEQNNSNKEPIQQEQEAQEELSVERVEENVQAEPEMVKEELPEDLQQGKDVQRLEEVRLQEELRKQERLALEQKEQELAQEQALQEQIRQEELAKEQELLAKQEEERVLQEQQKKEQELFEQQEREKEIAQQEAERQEIALREQEEMRLQEELRKQEQLALEQKEQELAQEQALQEQIRQEELAKEQELLAKQEEERVLQEQQKKEQELLKQQEREKEIAQQEAEREQKIRLAKQEQAQKELDILKQKETELVEKLEQEKEREKEATLALDELKAQELLAQKKREEAQKKEEELIELLKKIEKQDLLAQEELHNSKQLAEVKAQALAEAKIKEDRAREALEKLEFEYQQKQRELERQQKEQELLHKVEQVDSAAQVEPFKQDFQPIAEAEPIPEIPQKVQSVTLENYNDELAQARFPKKEITIEKENIVEKEPSEQPKEVRPLEETESPQELIQQEQIKTESVELEPSEFAQEPVFEIQLQTPVEERPVHPIAIGTQHTIPTVAPITSLPSIVEAPLLQEKQPVIGGLTSAEKVVLPPRKIESLAETLSELKKEEGIKDSKKEVSLAQEKESGSFETISKKPPLVPLGQKNLSPSYSGRSAETYPKIPARQESLGAQKPFNDRSDTYPQGQKISSSGKQEQYQVHELLEQNGTYGEGRVQPSQKENWRSIIDKYGISSAPQTESVSINKPSRPSESLNRPELVTDYSQIPEESSLNKELPRHTSYSGKSNQQQPKAEKPKKIKKEQPSESVWVALLQVFAMLGALGLFFGIIIRTIVKFFRR